jgi:serine/threonine protein kinase
MPQNGKVIAVKKIKSSFMPGMQRQFENEVCHLMMLKHPNVVRCMGYCYETRNECLEYNGKYVFAEMAERLLCLEYLPKGSLDKYISGKPFNMECSFLNSFTLFKL